jgi:GTPase involved in cell partitioning and DNA repair
LDFWANFAELKTELNTYKRFYARNPNAFTEIITAHDEYEIEERKSRSAFPNKGYNRKYQTISKKTGYPVKWIKEALTDNYRRQRKKEKEKTKKERSKCWWHFWRRE